MLDQTPETLTFGSDSDLVEPRRSRGRPERYQVDAQFGGVLLWLSWTGSTSDLIERLRHAAIGQPFGFTDLSYRGVSVWSAYSDAADVAQLRAALPAGYIAFFAAEKSARNRAEAHVPRLLESVGVRVSWQQMRKTCLNEPVVPDAQWDGPGDWSSLPVAKPAIEGGMV